MSDLSVAQPRQTIPWLEDAVATRRARRSDPFSTFVLAQGSLVHVAAMVGALPKRDQALTRIALPSRIERPFQYEGEDVQRLIAALPDAGFGGITQPPAA